MTLEGKVALVTGGSQGIGAAIAKKLASEGADIAILYVGNPAPAEETVAAIEAMGRRVICKVCDVSNFEDTQAAVKDVIAQMGGVDILVNNAGITRDKVLLAMTEADWDAVLDVNLKSMFNTIKACYRNFMKKKAGKIINILSLIHIWWPMWDGGFFRWRSLYSSMQRTASTPAPWVPVWRRRPLRRSSPTGEPVPREGRGTSDNEKMQNYCDAHGTVSGPDGPVRKSHFPRL